MSKQITHIYSLLAVLLCTLLMCNSCTDEMIGGSRHLPLTPDGDGNVTIRFSTQVPGMVIGSRTAGNVDEKINKLNLYLFDQSGFTKVVAATPLEYSTNQYDETKGEYTDLPGTTYTAKIPEDTKIIHFVANNVTLTQEEITAAKGKYEDEFFPTFITDKKTYWGRHTMQELSEDKTVVLYRNYAKVEVGTVATESGITIEGWTLYYEPTKATVAPFNRKNSNKFDYVLGTSGVTLPKEKDCEYKPHNETNRQAAENNITANAGNQALTLFEHSDAGYSQRVCAIFKIKKKDASKYYKIELLEDTEWSDDKKVIGRTPYDIKRNHEYVINFNGITPELGWSTFDEAIANGAANNSNIEVEEVIPEIVSLKHTLRVEEDANGSSTVRYYKNYTGSTTYTINDIEIYYDGDDCSSNTSAIGVNSLKAVWQEEMEGANSDFTFTKVDDKDHTYKLSFTTTEFTEGENGSNHYKTGLIRISEQHEHLLSRYVRVYLGPAITFRPLLISSDIPNEVDERLTVLFTIPDESYLPADLYPIEIRFGSDRVDVERNLAVDAMKVDFGNNAADDYEYVLRWKGTDTGSTDWNWKAEASDTVKNTWGYKYIYTLNSPQEAGEKRITLRTVVKGDTDFKVMLEGRSTVTGTSIFNTRELDFMMQNGGTATFNNGAWTSTGNSSHQYQRIMLDKGLAETRYVTAHINVVGDSTVSQQVPVAYTLGTLANDSLPYASALSNDVVIWAHYDPTKLIPPTGTTPDVDANGNTFVSITHNKASNKDTLMFSTVVGQSVKNSMVFLTARNKAKYGSYESSTFTEGKQGFIYTGVNELAQTYRSAGAIVSVQKSWQFNPAPSSTGLSGSYSFATDIAIEPGKDKDLYLRIDRPMATDGVILKFDTGSKLTLQASSNSDYTINNDGTVTLAGNSTSEYCYLHFKAASFNSACTIKMSSAQESSISYTPAEVTVTNTAVSFLGFKFANETSLDSTNITYSETQDTVPPIKGALLGVRVYFPSTLMDQGTFSFNLTSAKFQPINYDSISTMTTVLGNASQFNNYKVSRSTRSKNTSIISVNSGALKQVTDKDSCYLDLLVKSTAISSTESVKFLGTNEASSDISFYPYNVAFRCSKETYEQASVQQSLDNSTWTSDALTGIDSAGKDIYYKVSLPNLGLPRKLEVILKSKEMLKVPATSVSGSISDGTENTDGSITFVVTTAQNATSEAILHLQSTRALGTAEAANVNIHVGGDPFASDDIVDLGDFELTLMGDNWVNFGDQNGDNEENDFYYNIKGKESQFFPSSLYPENNTNRQFSVSEDTEVITLRLKAQANSNGTYEETTLTLKGWNKDYAFQYGTNETINDSYIQSTITLTPDENGYIYPVIEAQHQWNKMNSLKWWGGDFSISGSSTSFKYYERWIDINIKPRILVSLCDNEKNSISNYTYNVEDKIYLKVTVPARHTGNKTIDFKIASRKNTQDVISAGTGDGISITTAETIGGTAAITMSEESESNDVVAYYYWTASTVTTATDHDIRVEATRIDYNYDWMIEINEFDNASKSFSPIKILDKTTIILPEANALDLNLATISGSSKAVVKTGETTPPQFDCFTNGDVATFTLNNTIANAIYNISFGAATNNDGSTLELKITNESGVTELEETIEVTKNGWQTFDTYNVETQAMSVGFKTFTITFKHPNGGYTSNVNNIIFKQIE